MANQEINFSRKQNIQSQEGAYNRVDASANSWVFEKELKSL